MTSCGTTRELTAAWGHGVVALLYVIAVTSGAGALMLPPPWARPLWRLHKASLGGALSGEAVMAVWHEQSRRVHRERARLKGEIG